MNPVARQTLELYIIVLAALCGGLATWLLTGWGVRWMAGWKRLRSHAPAASVNARVSADGSPARSTASAGVEQAAPGATPESQRDGSV
ncbi:MAG TPA: hypothetical protein PK349_13570 [Candidatus Hydrogenedentes bacterium]|nr:hypothetical protein [Candidatus Hydrogenedentota bacterium]